MGAIGFEGLLIAGNGPTKEKLLKCKALSQSLLILRVCTLKEGGRNGFTEMSNRLRNGLLSEEVQRDSESVLVERVLGVVADHSQADMVAIGLKECLRAMELRIMKEWVVAEAVWRFVICKGSEAVRWVKTERELHAVVKEMGIEVEGTGSGEWEVKGFMEFVKGLCEEGKVQLEVVGMHNDKTFVRELGGCVGLLHQSFQYMNHETTQKPVIKEQRQKDVNPEQFV